MNKTGTAACCPRHHRKRPCHFKHQRLSPLIRNEEPREDDKPGWTAVSPAVVKWRVREAGALHGLAMPAGRTGADRLPVREGGEKLCWNYFTSEFAHGTS